MSGTTRYSWPESGPPVWSRRAGRLRDEENGPSMSRVSVTEQAKLSLFLARAILRALLGQFAAFWIYRRPEVVSRRIISWLTQAPLLVDDSDVRFYRRFIRSLNRQVRALRVTLAGPRDGVPRLQAVIALVYASLCMQGQARHIEASM